MMDESKVEKCYWGTLRHYAVQNDERFGHKDAAHVYLGAATAFGSVLGKNEEEIFEDIEVAMRDEYAESPERLKAWSAAR